MKILFRSVFPPLMSLVIVMLGNGFFNTFSSLRIAEEGYDNIVIGLVNSAYYLGMMVGCLYIEKLISRIGHIRAFAIFASINSLVFLFQGFYIHPIPWGFFRLLTGFCSSGFFIVIESWMLLSTSSRYRGKLLSLYMLTLYFAQGLGQFILNAVSLKSIFPYVIAIGLSSLSVLPVSMMKSSGPLGLDHSSLNLWKLIKKAPIGPLGCFLAGMIMSSFYGLTPIFAKNIHLSLFQISQVMGGTILGGLVLQWPIGHLSDIFPRKYVLIAVSSLLFIITSILFLFYSSSYWFLLLFMIIFGSVAFTFYPLSISYTCDYFAQHRVIGVTSSLLIIYGIGCVLGPIASSSAMQFFGPSYLLLTFAILSILFVIIALFLIKKNKQSAEDDLTEYLPTPRATALGYYLDPKVDTEDKEDFEDEEGEIDPLYEEYEDDDEQD
ncbi:hypothetical protein COB21_04605 [Candidatus Aerophobetes bacterium]|uniref:Major facilitator superfamily (MFS) profile domain-containing protein n=1 Tax=Aerophobetes bacterium TaxID=2030807 RepID=A0A2A4X198_UNCAE|nr:MAG: hypothetical protein COB21_04605 [Candidatus Aerophobetes bacterium]